MSRSVETSNRGENFQAIVPGLCEPLNFTNTSGYSVDLEEETTLVELFATQDCWIQIIQSDDNSTVAQAGSSGAASYNRFLPGGIINFLGVPKTRGVQYKIAVVRATASNGILYITQGRD